MEKYIIESTLCISSKPRPVEWVQRRERLDEVGSIWPVADDVSLGSVDLDGVPGEAPVHPFPAAIDDALTVWRYVRNQGVAAGRIAVGGGLTVALISRLRDAGEALPGCAWLVSPWTDLTMSGETLVTKDAIDPIIHKSYLGELADAYLPGDCLVLERISIKAIRLIRPYFADVFIGRQAFEGFEAFGEVVGHQESMQMLFQVIV
jgi:hypothetical protein